MVIFNELLISKVAGIKLSVHLTKIHQLRSNLALQNRQLRSDAAKLAQTALLKEVDLTPKPGLVDQMNNGAHRDMNLITFLQSIAAITPYLDEFYYYGTHNKHTDNRVFLADLRVIGLKCEAAMFLATSNINTHKGAIFALGLILSSLGRLEEQNKSPHYSIICNQVATLCQGMVERELISSPGNTVGEKLYRQYGLTGARGEAQNGYTLIQELSLPVYFDCLKKGYTEQQSLWQSMLHLLANNNDTNVVSRGGMSGLNFVKDYATKLLNDNSALTFLAEEKLQQFDNLLIEKNLSPGGTADLIAVTWFLSHYNK
ncbi:triphosphoribosyl-dephospho-CoA synthase CitG [Orbus sturtevantii]|uniref:triphosphoribosyl-dephospho-CoA synthase CitG n=1 Tax=Orbus sturtevantii TaxID=3074109 RepID=UPI00370DCE0A